jgi:replication initiation protein RepC
MAFRKPAVEAGRPGALAPSATDGSSADHWSVFRALRDAHGYYGLRANHLQSLQAMLSFLKPGQGEIVFACNTEICRRIGGIDERTLRRHIQRLIDRGFISRHDSPNLKRYRVRASNGASLSFGLSLAPFLERAAEIIATAQQLQQEHRDKTFLRKKILAQLTRLDEACGETEQTISIRKTLRRKLTMVQYESISSHVETVCDGITADIGAVKPVMLSANDGQHDRQLSKSLKESIDKETDEPKRQPNIGLLSAVCTEACSFALNAIKTWEDVETHARTMAPMMGIDAHLFEQAAEKQSAWKAASAIFILLQMGRKVRSFAAYFQSLTTGAKSHLFDPGRVLLRMSLAPDTAAI